LSFGLTSQEYLRGKGTEDECQALFKAYNFEQSALKERGIDKMLEEARADHKDSDEVHMRRKCE
jgi:TRIAP1/MDM35 family protein